MPVIGCWVMGGGAKAVGGGRTPIGGPGSRGRVGWFMTGVWLPCKGGVIMGGALFTGGGTVLPMGAGFGCSMTGGVGLIVAGGGGRGLGC
jgi:hypothetical protein